MMRVWGMGGGSKVAVGLVRLVRLMCLFWVFRCHGGIYAWGVCGESMGTRWGDGMETGANYLQVMCLSPASEDKARMKVGQA